MTTLSRWRRAKTRGRGGGGSTLPNFERALDAAAPNTGIGAFAVEAFRAQGLKPPQATVVTYSMHM